MAKKVVKAASSSAMACCMCGSKNCNCGKMKGAAKVLMALALLGYAGGYLSLPLAAGVVGVLVGIGGLMILAKH